MQHPFLRTLPAGAWDTHCHTFDPIGHPYEEDSPYIPPASSVEDLIAAVPTSNFCIVMAMPEGARPELALESVAKLEAKGGGRKARATIVLDFAKVTDEQLKKLHEQGVRSVRIHTRGAITKGLSGDEAMRQYIIDVAERIAPMGWCLDGQLRTDKWAALAPTVIELNKRLGITFVADHCFYLGPEDYGSDAWKACLSLVESGALYVKISGQEQRIVKGEDLSPMRDVVTALASAHNGERCLFGSDWPHVILGATDLMHIDARKELGYLKEWLEPRIFENLLVHNPDRLYQ